MDRKEQFTGLSVGKDGKITRLGPIGVPVVSPEAEVRLHQKAALTRAWRVELGRRIAQSNLENLEDGVARAKSLIAEAKQAIEDGKKPPETQPALKTPAEKEQAFIVKKNHEALGRWALGWKAEDGNDSDFAKELTRQQAETRAKNGSEGETVALREDAVPPISGGAFGRRVLAAAPGLRADIQDFPAWFDRLGDVADPGFRLPQVWRGIDVLTNMCIQRGIPLNRPDVDFMFAQLDNLTNDPAMLAKEQGLSQGGVISSAAATESYDRAPDKVAWVRDRIKAIRNEGGVTAQLSNYDVEYMELRGAMRRIKETNMALWAEAGYQFAAVNVGATAKACAEIPQMLDVAGPASPEFFQVLFRLQLNRQVGGAQICGVAECFRALERHRLDYYKVPKDDKGGYLDVIAWEMEGYPYPVARARQAAGMIPPNRWAAQTAHDIWTGTFRNIIPVRDPANGKILYDSYVYPAYRLATIETAAQKNPKLKPFFRGEGNRYIDPFFVDFWTYIGENYNKNNPADARQANAMACNFLVPDARGNLIVPPSLENVRFETMDFVKSAATGESLLIPGIYPKWLGYAANVDKFRDTMEGAGMYINPTWETFTKHIGDKLWKNLDPPHYAQAICLAAEGIIEFHRAYVGPIGFLQRIRRWGIGGFFGGWPFTMAFAGLNRRSYSEAEMRQSKDAVAWSKYDIQRKLENLVDDPFNVDWNDPALRRLRAKYHIPWSTTIVEGVRSLLNG
jgi:hypothetical protein